MLFKGIKLAASFELVDREELYLVGSERDLIDLIFENPSLIEDGFRPLEREKPTRYGMIDIYGTDRNGNGVVVDPQVLLQEIDELQKRGYFKNEDQLLLSEDAHLIMPYHRRMDVARERIKGEGKIGTTGRGIGPATRAPVRLTVSTISWAD